MLPMIAFAYLAALIISLAGLFYLDYRYRLAFFTQPQLTIRVIAISVIFFLAWDVAGVYLDVFSTNQQFVSGLNLGHPDLPIEEPIFLILLSYVTLLVWRARTQ